ncbi:MAG: hypothetical protein ACYC7D_08625 [Nitrososphaerales archaeon]
MYSDHQISISSRYLEAIIREFSDPPCLLGGWAVYIHLNDKFNSSKGRDYVGSKDIDLGFHLDPTWSEEEYGRSDLRKAIGSITSLGFEAVSFRFMKSFSQDGTELTKEQARRFRPYEMFDLYIDILVDTADERRHKLVGFSIAEEPLLQNVFLGKQKDTKRFNDMDIVLPDPSLLIEMKINSFPNRGQDDKKTKDLTDLCALLLYSSLKLPLFSNSKEQLTRRENFKKAISDLSETEWNNVARILDEEKSDLKRVVAEIYP